MAGPLKGMKVLDFSALLPGPFGTMILGDLGAEVLKVEAPNRPDLMRFAPPYDGGESSMHHVINRNKKSIGINLKFPEGVELVKKLVRVYDIMIEQFRPGVMEKLGVGYETLKKENPRLIYCSITGYGQTGPYRDRAGHDINYLSTASIPSFSHRKGERPFPQAVQIADVGAGSYQAVVAILAAVIHREKTGEGQYLDVSMTDGAVSWITHHAPYYLIDGKSPGAEDAFLSGGVHFYDYYETKDGRFMSVGSIEPQFYADLCRGLGREDLKAKQNVEGQASAELKAELRKIFSGKTQKEWIEIFAKLDACVEPVLTMGEMCDHPHTRARKMVIEVKKPDGTPQKQIASPFKLSATPPEIRSVGPKMGEHTNEAMKAVGYLEKEIQALREKGVVA